MVLRSNRDTAVPSFSAKIISPSLSILSCMLPFSEIISRTGTTFHHLLSSPSAVHHPHQRIPLTEGLLKFLFRCILILCPNTLSRCVHLICINLRRLPLQIGVFLQCLLRHRREPALLLTELLQHSFNHCHSLLQFAAARIFLASGTPENRSSSGFQFLDVLRLFRNLGGKLFVLEHRAQPAFMRTIFRFAP